VAVRPRVYHPKSTTPVVFMCVTRGAYCALRITTFFFFFPHKLQPRQCLSFCQYSNVNGPHNLWPHTYHLYDTAAHGERNVFLGVLKIVNTYTYIYIYNICVTALIYTHAALRLFFFLQTILTYPPWVCRTVPRSAHSRKLGPKPIIYIYIYVISGEYRRPKTWKIQTPSSLFGHAAVPINESPNYTCAQWHIHNNNKILWRLIIM